MTVGEPENLDELLAHVPEGWSRRQIEGHPWGVTRTTRASGRVITLEAERLDTGEAIGANVWLTDAGTVLRPCEIPADVVMDLLRANAAGETTPG